MTHFGSELRRRRLSVGMSLTALSAAIHFTKGYLSKIENGKARVNRPLAEACDRVLGAKGELLVLAVEAFGHDAGGIIGIPERTRHFVGRKAELTELCETLVARDGARICLVSGMAGTGKTTIAIAAARAVAGYFPDGCLFFDLRGHTPGVAELTPAEGLYRLLCLLDVPAEHIPPDIDGRANLSRNRLRDRRVLLVLDNVRTADQVKLLVPGEPSCRAIVTSRSRLPALDDAWHLPVGMLSPPDAMALFRSVAGDRMPPDEVAVLGIIEHCGMLPLAIRIAAARFVSGGWTAAGFRDRLADQASRLIALDDGERSVATAFEVSYEVLPSDQRRVFGLLAIYPGTVVETAAIDALAGLDPGETDRVLDRLHDANLLTRDETGHVELHDLVRVFAERYALPETDPADREPAVCRLVDYALGKAIAADELVEPSRYRPNAECRLPSRSPFADVWDALRWLRRQWPILVELVELAAAHELHRRCWHLAYVLRAFFYRDKLFDAWIRTHSQALRSTRVCGDVSGTGMILNNLGMAYVEVGELDQAASCHREAHGCFVASSDQRGVTDALSSLAWVRLYQGDPETTLRELTAALAEYRQTDRSRNVVIALRGIAFALTELGRFAEALVHAEEARSLAERPDDVILCVTCLAWVHFRTGRLDEADAHYRAAADRAELAGYDYEYVRACTGCGNVAARRGDLEAAARWWRATDHPVVLNPVVAGEARVRNDLERLVRAE